MKTNKIKARNDILEIIKNGKLHYNSNTVNIDNELKCFKNKQYRANDIDAIKIIGGNNECKFIITANGSSDIPFLDIFTDEKICILNFASSKHPGGGFMTGAYAQEEDLCYHSNLYKALSECQDFYNKNNEKHYNGLYLDGIIYSENILFFKQKFNNVEPTFANVITCAAPNKGVALRKGVTNKEIDKTMSRRIEQILNVAIDNKQQYLVLGAFGCGVFKNDIRYVASEIKRLLIDKNYCKYFKYIIIPALSKEDRVYKVFSNEFKDIQNLILE